MKRKTPLQKWLKALRQQKITQSYTRLKDQNAFCAVGLLFQVNGYLDAEGKVLTGRKSGKRIATRKEALQLLRKLKVSLDLVETVIEMNDKKKIPLPEIADFIEVAAKELTCLMLPAP